MKNSITFKKLILLFLAVSIPFFLLSLFLLYQHKSIVQYQTFSALQEKSNIIAQTLTDTIEQLYHTATAVSEQGNLNQVANPRFPATHYEAIQSMLQLQEQQTSIMNANPYIENFVIYYQEKGQAFNSTNNKRANFFYFSQEQYQELIDLRMVSDFFVLYNQKLTEIIMPSINSNFLIRIDLSSQAVTSLLEETFIEYETYYYLLDAFDHEYQLTNFAQDQLEQLPVNNLPNQLIIDGKQYHHFSSALPHGETQLHFFFSNEELFADTKIYQYLNFFFGAYVLFACFFFLIGCYTIIHKPIQILLNAFQDINNQNYAIRIFSKKTSDFTYLYNEFNHMAKELEILIKKDYQQLLLLNKAELKQLQAQINPHFLYNSLFLLRRMLQDELYEEAYHMSDTLGLYFQYITRNSQDNMPLSKEYHHAVLYCEIQKLRFEGRISIETDELPAEYSNMLVPKLIIQPILENAFNYGLCDKVSDGLLRVTVASHPSGLTIFIEDNGESLSDDQLAMLQNNLLLAATGNPLLEMTGLSNIQRRLNIYFDGSGGLKASRSPLGGLCIQLFLPLY